MDTDKVYLQHILESIAKIEKFVEGSDFKKFSEDEMAQSAAMRELGIIGEAAKKLSEEFKEKHNDVPWKQIVGMRDKLVHDYFEIDLEAVWEAVEKDLPLLKKEVEKET